MCRWIIRLVRIKVFIRRYVRYQYALTYPELLLGMVVYVRNASMQYKIHEWRIERGGGGNQQAPS